MSATRKTGQFLRDVLLIGAVVLLCAIGLTTAIVLRKGAFDNLPAANQNLVERLEGLPADATYFWKDFLPKAEEVCIVSFDTDPRLSLPATLRRPVRVPDDAVTALRPQHWSIARVDQDMAELFYIPLTRLRLDPDTDRCDSWLNATFRVTDQGDKRLIQPQRENPPQPAP